ncbi:MAG TPA: efflux RND transporter periplasmic adaptor subunit [Verrucomicrobiae bacterium]|nr:efflux RND transporter periplasmic adaptor subunit [Verrucomicrobiae bacterium]
MAVSCQRPADPNSVSGTIETDEVHVASRYGGRVERLFAREGDLLTNGQLIAELEAAELRAMRAQAAATLDELLAGPRPQEIIAASNDWQALVAELDLARLEDKRSRELIASKVISETERDRTRSRVASLEKSAAAARSRFDLLLAGTRPERIAQARARLDELDAHLCEMRIAAPTNCLLEVLEVKIGDVLPPNREIATLLLIDHLWVRVYVPQPWLGQIHIGQKVGVKADAFPAKEFEGVVEQVNRVAEFTPRNVQTPGERLKQVFGVKVRQSSAELRAGMSVDVLFPNMVGGGEGVK